MGGGLKHVTRGDMATMIKGAHSTLKSFYLPV